jgi:acyl transferase domain-containing protein/acyl carrier protein
VHQETDQLDRIAVIGMAGRFPGAPDVDRFWQNLSAGVESVTTLTDEQLLSSGVEPSLVQSPNYVKAGLPLDGAEFFDAEFFGYTPREAELTDPQHRVFLECAWQAMEDAGYDPDRTPLRIGVYAGAGTNSYFQNNLAGDPHLMKSLNLLQRLMVTDNDYLSTRVSYKLNLKGPGLTVQTACSTSLVATHLACQSLLNGECDIALAGGVSVRFPQTAGYLYQEGSPLSADGRCRAFDASAQGMMPGSGAGVVVLKRLADALRDGDSVRAVILGSAINNDGAAKIGYTAPSVDGQAGAIEEAQALAGVSADEITYIEAHGTGTVLGDPIEIAGLTKAFRRSSQERGSCAIGSVKTNIGHLGAAAGIAGFIKVVLALQKRMLPPSLNFKRPNPAIDFANSPFFVQQTLEAWRPANERRVAGISSFGIGGTNAHAVLEEAPATESSGPSRPWQLLLLSARTNTALDAATRNLAARLRDDPSVSLADVAYTLQTGRKGFHRRRMLVCHGREDAIAALESLDPRRVSTQSQEPDERDVVFMFPGQGAQYANMSLELYRTESEFQEHVDRCCESLKPHLSLDLRDILYPGDQQVESASQTLKQTRIAQPALFVIEYALAKLLMSWGVKPAAMVGHSIGEYVAACLAGVFSLEDALSLVAARGRLMQSLPEGSMLAVSLSEEAIAPLLNGKLSVAAVNSPSLCVVSGEMEAVSDLQRALSARDVACTLLHTSHAFHSKMMDPILVSFTQEVERAAIHPPKIPILSSVTGAWIQPAEMATPGYWARNLRQTVRFSDCVRELMNDPARVLLEVGPGTTLGTLAKQHPGEAGKPIVLSTIRHPREQTSDVAFLLNTLGRLWLANIDIDWSGFYKNESRHRISLPAYPFERQRYCIEPSPQAHATGAAPRLPARKSDIADWFYVPSWKRAELPEQGGSGKSPGHTLLFLDDGGFGLGLAALLQAAGQRVTVVQPATAFRRHGEDSFTVNPGATEDYDALWGELGAGGQSPDTIVHLWSLTGEEKPSIAQSWELFRKVGFNSLLFLTQAIGKHPTRGVVQIKVISNRLHAVTGDEVLSPAKAILLGPCRVIPQEHPNIQCTSVDLGESRPVDEYASLLAKELNARTTDAVVAYRGTHRWVPAFEHAKLSKSDSFKPRLREQGVYLITGGLGGIGLVLAEYLAESAHARLVLISRTGLPDREQWPHWLETHGDKDDVSQKIRKVQSIERHGATVLILKADVADNNQMKAAIAQAHDRFGEIHGVIHAAGTASFGTIRQKDPAAAASVMAPKVLGTAVLAELLGGTKLDWFVLCSSLAADLGGIGRVDYSSANAFLNAYAQKYHSEQNVIAINWCAWQEVGMALSTAVPAELQEQRERNLLLGIVPEQGKEAFARIIGRSHPQVLVSLQDLTGLAPERDEGAAVQETKPPAAKPAHPRPDLSSDYVVPGNATEQTIADIWQELLGVANVGIHDNFFELGGHSLLATGLVARLKSELPIELSMASLFENPTVHLLSEMVLQAGREEPSFDQSRSRGQMRKQRLRG